MEERQASRTPPDDARHPSKEAVGRFVSNTSTREEAKAVVRHLLRRCPRCARQLLDQTGAR
jgi:hypothetical protein